MESPDITALFNPELLATVSHELRSPLTAIKGYAATLLRHDHRISREERRDFLLAIQNASNRLELIVDRLLEMSQLEAGAIAIQPSAVNVVQIADEALMMAEQRVAEQSPGRFAFHLHLKDTSGRSVSDEPLILADPRRLREVLDNLLENAMLYSPEGGVIDVVIHPVQQPISQSPVQNAVRIEEQDRSGVVSTSTQKPHQLLEICVCDHGSGIPPEHIERIFERFHRVDTRLTREVNGLGLGLTISKYIVELHNGLIWAESCPAGGSAFHVCLPVNDDEPLSSELVASPSPGINEY